MEKNINKDLKVIENDDKLTVDDRITIKELEDKIVSMKEDKEKKCKAAKEQLIEMLDVTADKYRTATGTAEALRILRFVAGDDKYNLYVKDANALAYKMAEETLAMRDKAQKLAYVKMDQLCDGFYEKDFHIENMEDWAAIEKLAFEMMRIDLCRNVGGSAEDMVSFIKRTQEEIDATGEKLKQLKANQKKD